MREGLFDNHFDCYGSFFINGVKIGNMVNYTLSISEKTFMPKDFIQRVVFNDPETIVFWKDGTKTVVKCQNGDEFNKEFGLLACITKKVFGNKSNYNNIINKWIDEEER